ncbi:MAG TPA: site-specific DNA-methyltransferase [Abditibacteriaceae bacterium]|jgi:site-specific DNA-methyltransferase (adenine-specific)
MTPIITLLNAVTRVDAKPEEKKKPAPTTDILHGDCLDILPCLPAECARLVVADPPYYNVLKQNWDTQWNGEEAYLEWSMQWMEAAMRTLVPGGLLYCFGQTGKREHVFLHLMSRATEVWNYHDLLIWDRVVGYNERGDSFTPAYEMILVLRKEGPSYFNKDAVREPYDRATREKYARDKRYKDRAARLKHLNKGKKATNLWSLPSLKGASKEKCGHPSQKPEKLIERIVKSSSKRGELIIDPFLGSGTTAFITQKHKRSCIGIEQDARYIAMARARLSP